MKFQTAPARLSARTSGATEPVAANDNSESRQSFLAHIAALTKAADGLARARRDPAAVSLRQFPSLGHNLRAIAAAENGGPVDSRLVRAPAGASTNDPAAGGFLIQTDFASDLLVSVYENAVLAPLCDLRTTDHPTRETKIPAIDETSRADGSRSGGVAAYWEGEADSVSPSFPRFKSLAFQPRKLISKAYTSAELLADAPMLEATFRKAFSDDMSFRLDTAILRGTGAGMPLGLLNSTGLITVAKAVGQASATIVAENIAAMWKRLPASSRRRAVWLVSEDAEEQLATLTGAAGPLYVRAGVGGNPWPTMMGRPLIAIEQASPIGAVGDIIIADLSQYVVVGADINVALSAHPRFDNDEIVWRIKYLVDGKSIYASPITPFSGSTTRSPFVTLGAR